jgi:assimilatory nitrate reductase electron transfer subunit
MVTKGQLRDAWYGGSCSRSALSAATRAATGCGGCGDDLDAFCSWMVKTSCPRGDDPAARDHDSATDPQLGALR